LLRKTKGSYIVHNQFFLVQNLCPCFSYDSLLKIYFLWLKTNFEIIVDSRKSWVLHLRSIWEAPKKIQRSFFLFIHTFTIVLKPWFLLMSKTNFVKIVNFKKSWLMSCYCEFKEIISSCSIKKHARSTKKNATVFSFFLSTTCVHQQVQYTFYDLIYEGGCMR